jgi:hypothetical protein
MQTLAGKICLKGVNYTNRIHKFPAISLYLLYAIHPHKISYRC